MRNEIIPLQIKEDKEGNFVLVNNTPPPLLEENISTETLKNSENLFSAENRTSKALRTIWKRIKWAARATSALHQKNNFYKYFFGEL